MKVEVSFDDLPAYDAKYQPHCFTTYMRNSKFDQTSTMHRYCFQLLICESDPPLNEGRALSMTIPLNQFKSILKDNDYNLFDSYLLVRQIGMLEILKLIMGLLRYQPTSEKTFLFKPPLIMEITVRKQLSM